MPLHAIDFTHQQSKHSLWRSAPVKEIFYRNLIVDWHLYICDNTGHLTEMSRYGFINSNRSKPHQQQQQQQLCVYACMCVCLCKWVWMHLYEGASEEKGSCGTMLKAFNSVQLCRTPTTEEKQNESAEFWQWIMKGRQGGEHWERRHRTTRTNWRWEPTYNFALIWYKIKKTITLLSTVESFWMPHTVLWLLQYIT